MVEEPTFMAYELRLLWHMNPDFYATCCDFTIQQHTPNLSVQTLILRVDFGVDFCSFFLVFVCFQTISDKNSQNRLEIDSF